MTLKQVAQYLQLAERSALRMLCRIAGPAGEVKVIQELKQAFGPTHAIEIVARAEASITRPSAGPFVAPVFATVNPDTKYSGEG